MLRFFFLLFLTCSSSIFFGQEIEMKVFEIDSFKIKVYATSIDTKSIISDFVQYKHLDFLDNDIEASGKLAFKSPDLVKWEYTKPYQYSVIFKEDKLLINDGGKRSNVKIGSNKMFKKLNELIVNSIKGSLFDDDDFIVSYFKTPEAIKVIFKPKEKKWSNYIAAFELLFDKEYHNVFEVKMVEPSSDFTRILFSNRVINGPLNDGIFSN